MGTHTLAYNSTFWQCHEINVTSSKPKCPTKKCPNKSNQAPCRICYTEKNTTLPKVTTVDTSNLLPGELIQIEFSFYNVTSIHVFTSMLTVFCENNRALWVFHTASKYALFRIFHFILTTLKNEHHPCKHIRVSEDGALANSTNVTKLLVGESKISM